MSEQPDQLERFRQEARAVAKLSHPNVVAVIDAGEDGGHPYIVFEYVEGETLKQRIARLGALDTQEALAYAIEIARGLDRRPRPQHGPPRHQAPERPDRRRGPGEADRLRDLPPARAGRDDRHRPRPRHHRLRRPRAGDGARGRPPLRHLLARRRPLRDADRPGPLPRRQPGRRGDETRQRGAARRAAAPARGLRRGSAGGRARHRQGPRRALPGGRRDDRRPLDRARGRGGAGGLDHRRGDQRARRGAAAQAQALGPGALVLGGDRAAGAGRLQGRCWRSGKSATAGAGAGR